MGASGIGAYGMGASALGIGVLFRDDSAEHVSSQQILTLSVSEVEVSVHDIYRTCIAST